MTRHLILSVLISVVSLAGCAANRPPATAPFDFSNPPPLVHEGYATHIAQARFPHDPATTRAFMDDGNKTLKAMPETENIPKIESYTLLKGQRWPEAGAVRRLNFADGHYAMERAIEFSPERFSYQVWDFTSKTGNNVAYVYGVQELKPRPDGGSDFVWTYSLKPNAGWKRPIVQRFVDRNISVLLDTASASVAAQANEDDQ